MFSAVPGQGQSQTVEVENLQGCREAGCEQSCGCPSQGQHWDPVTLTEENLRKAFAGFDMVQSFFVVVF